MNITKSEQKKLNLLWEEGSLSTMQIVEKLEVETGWSKHAVISFLKKMAAMGLVHYEEKGLSKYYTALPEKEALAKEERASFLQNLYDGRLGLMVTAMAEEKSLSQEDIADLLICLIWMKFIL